MRCIALLVAALAICSTIAAAAPSPGSLVPCTPIPGSVQLKWRYQAFSPCSFGMYTSQSCCACNHPSAGNITVAPQVVAAGKQEYAIVSNIGDTYDLVNNQVIIGLQSGVMLQKVTGLGNSGKVYTVTKPVDKIGNATSVLSQVRSLAYNNLPSFCTPGNSQPCCRVYPELRNLETYLVLLINTVFNK